MISWHVVHPRFLYDGLCAIQAEMTDNRPVHPQSQYRGVSVRRKRQEKSPTVQPHAASPNPTLRWVHPQTATPENYLTARADQDLLIDRRICKSSTCRPGAKEALRATYPKVLCPAQRPPLTITRQCNSAYPIMLQV
jgi:hypothetical protein